MLSGAYSFALVCFRDPMLLLIISHSTDPSDQRQRGASDASTAVPASRKASSCSDYSWKAHGETSNKIDPLRNHLSFSSSNADAYYFNECLLEARAEIEAELSC